MFCLTALRAAHYTVILREGGGPRFLVFGFCETLIPCFGDWLDFALEA